jgi:NAD(P)-dependent dehydrogenase (short-subunit alcohol dehydrogenase family)
MAEEGASVIIAGRNRHRGEEAVALLGTSARFVEADMADAESVKRLSGSAGTSTSSSTTQPAFPPR